MKHETFSFCVHVDDLLCTGPREDLMLSVETIAERVRIGNNVEESHLSR